MSTIQIKKQDIVTVTVPLVSMTPMICHAWADKTKKQLLDKHMQKAAEPKTKKDPKADFLACQYKIGRNRYGFPADAFKSAAVRAGKLLDLKMVDLRQMFFVEGDGFCDNDPRQMVRIIGKPTIRKDMVRVSNNQPDVRFRAEFTNWTADMKVQFNRSLLSEEQLFNLFEAAGFSVGVGDWRPERNGTYGRFMIRRS